MPLTEAALGAWLYGFARLAGWTLLDPLTGRLPVALRLLLAAVLALALMPGQTLAVPPPFTVAGLLALGLEFAWGAALALCVWLVFAAAAAALTWTGHTATAGLLTLTAEQAAPADASWRALAGWLAAMAFLGASGHLLVVDALRDSFTAMPLAVLPEAAAWRQLAEAGAWFFAAGVQLALPLLGLVLLVQLAFALVARTTPGLDMFSAGLGIAAVVLVLAWIWAVPRISQGIASAVAQLATWIASLAGR